MDPFDIACLKHRFRRYRKRLIRQILKMSVSVLTSAVLIRLLLPALTEGDAGPGTHRLIIAVLLLTIALSVAPVLKLPLWWIWRGIAWESDSEIWVLRCDAEMCVGSAAKEAPSRVNTCEGFWATRKEMFRTGMLTGWDIALYLVATVALGVLMLAILPGESAVWAIWSLPVVAYLVMLTQQEDYIIARFLIMRGEKKS